MNKKSARVEVNISLAFLHWIEIALHPWPFVSDIATFVLKGDVKLQLTNYRPYTLPDNPVNSVKSLKGIQNTYVNEGKSQTERHHVFIHRWVLRWCKIHYLHLLRMLHSSLVVASEKWIVFEKWTKNLILNLWSMWVQNWPVVKRRMV